MTTGNIVRNLLNPVTVVFNGSPLTTGSAGSYQQRQWSGGDNSVKNLPGRGYEQRYYTIPVETRLRSGRTKQRLVRKGYRFYNRRVFSKEPNAYICYRYDNQYPVANLISSDYVLSTGALIGVNNWSNTPLSLFVNGGAPLAVSLTSNDIYRAIQHLREEVYGSSFNCAVMLGETSKTFQMIGDTAIKLSKSALLLKKGRFKEAIDATADQRSKRYSAKYASNPYLQVTYGWTPLLSDMKDGAESLAHLLNVPFKRRYRVRIKGMNSVPNGYNGFYHPTSPGWFTQMHGYSTVTRQIIAEIFDDPSWIPALGFTDPATFVWELTPFSFVADWFYPFGDWLEARASAGLLQGKFVVTDVQRVRFSGRYTSTFIDSGVNVKRVREGFDATSSVSYSRISRSVATGLDVPMPDYEPLLEANSVKHCVSGLALFDSVFGAKTKRGLKSSFRAIKNAWNRRHIDTV